MARDKEARRQRDTETRPREHETTSDKQTPSQRETRLTCARCLALSSLEGTGAADGTETIVARVTDGTNCLGGGSVGVFGSGVVTRGYRGASAKAARRKGGGTTASSVCGGSARTSISCRAWGRRRAACWAVAAGGARCRRRGSARAVKTTLAWGAATVGRRSWGGGLVLAGAAG